MTVPRPKWENKEKYFGVHNVETRDGEIVEVKPKTMDDVCELIRAGKSPMSAAVACNMKWAVVRRALVEKGWLDPQTFMLKPISGRKSDPQK